MIFDIPGQGKVEINTLILDLNGTLAVNGQIVDGAKQRLNELKEGGLEIVFFSGDTRGNAQDIADDLGIKFEKASNAADKSKLIEKLEPMKCAAIGNGLIDEIKLSKARIAIVTIQSEGVHTKSLLAADIIVPTINDALDLFLDEKKMIATMRK